MLNHFIYSKYKDKHNILTFLSNEEDNSGIPKQFLISDIKSIVNKSDEYLIQIINELIQDDDLKGVINHRLLFSFYISNDGIVSSLSKKYITEGELKLKNDLEYYIKNTSIIVGTIMAAITFVSNRIETSKNTASIKTLTKEMQSQTIQMKALKDSLTKLEGNNSRPLKKKSYN